MKRSHKIGVLFISILVVVLVITRVDIPIEQLPTPGNLEQARGQSEQLERDLALLQKEQSEYQRERQRLRQYAASFWPAPDEKAEVVVQSEFEDLAREARVTIDSLGGLQESEASDNIRKVEFSVQLNTSMQDFSRLLAQIENSPHNFYWDRCSIRPDDRRNPQDVRISGKIKAYVLTPAATRFIFGDEEEPAS